MAWHAHYYHACEQDPFPVGLTLLEADEHAHKAPDQANEHWELTGVEQEDLEAQFFSA